MKNLPMSRKNKVKKYNKKEVYGALNFVKSKANQLRNDYMNLFTAVLVGASFGLYASLNSILDKFLAGLSIGIRLIANLIFSFVIVFVSASILWFTFNHMRKKFDDAVSEDKITHEFIKEMKRQKRI